MLERNTIIPLADALTSRCPVCGQILVWYVIGDIDDDTGSFVPETINVESFCCNTYFNLTPHDVVVEITVKESS